MNKSKFYLTPDEINEIHCDVLDECGFADDEIIEPRLARKATNHAITTLIEQIRTNSSDRVGNARQIDGEYWQELLKFLEGVDAK